MLKVEEDFDDCNVGDEEEGSEAQGDPCGLGPPEDVQSTWDQNMYREKKNYLW